MKKKEKTIVAQNLKLIASFIRTIEMHQEIAFPNLEQANTQGTIRDCLKGIAIALVDIAETIEKW